MAQDDQSVSVPAIQATAMPSPYVIRIVVEKLFGQYDYDLLPTNPQGADVPNLLILYGENGTGKTTVLWLLYHLLSKEVGHGHKTFLARTRFATFSVSLADGFRIAAKRERNTLIGSYLIAIKTAQGAIHELYIKADEKNVVQLPTEEDKAAFVEFIKLLPELHLSFLPDTRRTIPDPNPEEDEESQFRAIRLMSGTFVSGQAMQTRRPESAPEIALGKVFRWVSKQALKGSTEGQLNVNAVYADIVNRIASPSRSRTLEASVNPDSLIGTLQQQAEATKQYSKFGFTSDLQVESFVRAIIKNRTSKQRLTIIGQILRPYLEGNAVRLSALKEVQEIVTTFVDSMNSFYVNKRVAFDLRDGVKIYTPDGKRMSPRVLSSGEKELMLLFCNVVMAKKTATIFIIDEPELSLNVIWQRTLISALLKLVGSSQVQFLLATHSIELLSLHMDCVMRLSVNTRQQNG